jgi:CCR4-NOT transcription complex subunit 7/8
MSLPSLSKSPMIRDVWADNLEAEFKLIRELLMDFPFVAMDTEFPGVVAKPVGSFKTTHEFYYQTLRCNVNLLKLIQLGISLLNERGEVPDKVCTWQFNFRFSLTEDIYAQDSIDLLRNGGIQFDHFARHGIEVGRFAELLISSGLVLNEDVRWLAFHAGYDFGYLMKLVSGRDLPEKEEEFTSQFHLMFPSVFDIKYLLRSTSDITHSCGLDVLSETLGVRRFGTAHQAGSDSLLTGHSFFKLVRDRLGNQMPMQANGILYGLSEDSASNAPAASTSTPLTSSSAGSLGAAGGSGMHTSSSHSNLTQSSPSQYTGSVPSTSAFPSTPLMNMVMHGGSRDAKVHQQQGQK